MSREVIVVYPECSENKNNRWKRNIFFSSLCLQVLFYQILLLMLFLPLSSVAQILCGPDDVPKSILFHLSTIEKEMRYTKEYIIMKDFNLGQLLS